MTQTDELREKVREALDPILGGSTRLRTATDAVMPLMEQVRADERERLARLAEFQAGYEQPAAQALKGWTRQYQQDAVGAYRWLRSCKGDKP